ncbi:MAG: hypothetical protein C0410_06855 [Anaerolinea sp.]|nr:hypothetical protein [Anaerolinea sp.]
MMKKLSAFFYRVSSGWVALIGLLVFVIFSVLVLPVESARVDAYSQGLGSPDTSFIYDSKMLLQMAEAYGEEGRSAFLTARWGFDLAFPLIFTFFFITSISFLFKKGLGGSSNLLLINLVPLLGLFFDLAENTATSVVMAAYPLVGTWGQFLAPVFTPIKWIFVTICMLLLFIGLLLWLTKRIKIINRQNN